MLSCPAVTDTYTYIRKLEKARNSEARARLNVRLARSLGGSTTTWMILMMISRQVDL